MNNLKLELRLSLYESDDKGQIIGNAIAQSSQNRIIDKNIRNSITDEALRNILREELFKAHQFSCRSLLNDIILPLNVSLKDKQEEILITLGNMFPGLIFSGYFSDQIFNINRISLNPFVGDTVNINHPIDGSYLTTKYTGFRSKLSDGTWTYGYQCEDYYEGIVEILDPPFDETAMDNYFKIEGINYEIRTYQLLPIPELKPEEEEEENV